MRAGQSLFQRAIRGLDVALPEELLGMDITPHAVVGREARKVTGARGRKQYSAVVVNGMIKDLRTGRTIGYTPAKAKKKYKVRRRSKRLTKRDQYIIEAMKEIAAKGGSAGSLVAML